MLQHVKRETMLARTCAINYSSLIEITAQIFAYHERLRQHSIKQQQDIKSACKLSILFCCKQFFLIPVLILY